MGLLPGAKCGSIVEDGVDELLGSSDVDWRERWKGRDGDWRGRDGAIHQAARKP